MTKEQRQPSGERIVFSKNGARTTHYERKEGRKGRMDKMKERERERERERELRPQPTLQFHLHEKMYFEFKTTNKKTIL